MEEWGPGRRLGYGTLQSIGLGFVAGALETAGLAASLELPLSVLDMLLVGVVDLLAMGALAALLGLLVGLPLHGVGRGRASTLLSLQLALVTFLLCGFFLWQMAWEVATVGQQPIGAMAMAAMPVGFAGVIYFNARFWLRKQELGKPAAVGWLPVSGAGALVVALGAALLYPTRDTGGDDALEGDKNVVIVTVDGLRRDAVGVLGGPSTPSVDALADGGMTFADAVSPTPVSRGANAAVLVGLHPLRHRVLAPSDVLSRGYRSLPEVLEREGWATGAFVSSRAVGTGSGLDQGFRVFDDDFAVLLPGTGRVRLVANLEAALDAVRDPGAVRGRDASATVDRFASWLDRHREVPFFAWVHLADPHRAALTGGDYAEAVQRVDAAFGRIREAVEAAGVADRTMIVFAGSHGELLGAHGGQGNESLYDEVVRVPLLLWTPGVRVDVPRVEPQVRLMDVPNGVLDWLRLDPLEESEGVELTFYGMGMRKATIWSPLVAPSESGWLLGLRNNGVKYIRHPDGREELYAVTDDPAELEDLSAEQADVVEKARMLLTSEAAALEKLAGSR